MEKIIFVDGTTQNYNGISNSGTQLTISVNGGDFAALESRFSVPDNLEKLIIADAEDNRMAAFKNYAILKEIRKRKNVVIDEIEEVMSDIVDVVLEKEPEWVVSQRKQDARLSAVEETADTLVMEALA